MLPRADIAGTRPVTLIEATAPASAAGQSKQETLDRLKQLMVGKDYQTQVLSRLANGNFLVQIGDAIASMSLPADTKTGDILSMTLLANQPRPTFLLGKPDGGGATMSLSNAGRLISDLLQLAKDGNMPTSIVGKTPLITTPGAGAQQIAGALQNAISFSGLFYESHVAQWALGMRPLGDLSREPVAKRTGNATTADQVQTLKEASSSGKAPIDTRAWTSDDHTLTELVHAKMQGLSLADTTDSTIDKQHLPLAAEGAKLLNMQLDTLEQRRVMWQGELFPGHLLQWEISDDTPQHEQRQPDEPASWQSTVRFVLPSLGAVSATIRLQGEHVNIQIDTDSAESADALRSHGGMLADALGAAGSTLDYLQVKQNG